MSIAASPVDVCNIASDMIGGDTVADIDNPTTDAEKIFARHYDNIRRETLREYIPNFAKKRAVISRLNITPVTDYTDAYQLPLDFIRLLSVGGDVEEDQLEPSRFDLADWMILVNNYGYNSLEIRYVSDVTDVIKWDSQFITLCAKKLALATAMQITGDYKVVSMMQTLVDRATPVAYGVDAQEKPPTTISRSPLLEKRRGYGRYDRDNRYIN
jgi:hypothetical protein